MIDLSWVVNHYVYPTHSTNISMLHYISFIMGVLLSTFKCTHISLFPCIVLPDFEEQTPEDYYEEESFEDDPAN